MTSLGRVLALFGLVSFLAVLQINGQQPCIPLAVTNITISFEAVVSWDTNATESCELSYFLVYVDSDVGTEYVYAVARNTLAVSFLPVCDNYIFRITPISTENVEGEEASLVTKIPLPVVTYHYQHQCLVLAMAFFLLFTQNTANSKFSASRHINIAHSNLTVAMVQVSHEPDINGVHLEWSMDDAWLKCADRFRVVIDDQEVDYLQDIYTFETSITIPDLSPCTTYDFGVVAIYNWAIEGPITIVSHAMPEGVQRPPRLTIAELQPTSANLVWTLDSYARNKCPVTQAIVRFFETNDTLTFDILDQTDREPFNVTLTNLTPDRIYLLNTTVINSAGESPAVYLAFQTTAN
ncbi:hypothetical protein NQ317_012778 [Molorchus minor]|uniref:Fibronectin type-III domain-containing protein n=1 Tax=Molorchus minor TaxID=1323400 RepID=A0ABQ9K536_9CUCU|nr:hypothetical protein NQ317_012778 [Molorchus minor]